MNEQKYPLPKESLPVLDLTHHLADLIELRTYLKGRGIETRNTRLDRYYHYLERAIKFGVHAVDSAEVFKNSHDARFKSPNDWYLYVLRELHELMWILKGLKTHAPKGVDAKLQAIVSGRDFAALDTESQSRNIQFELRIASYFCQAGCDVDMSQETDLIATNGKYKFFFECKRVGSKSQLEKRLSEARSQLNRIPGGNSATERVVRCIAIDVTKVAFEHNGLTFGLTPDHSRDVLQKKLIWIAEEFERFFTFDSCRGLCGYWLQIHIPAAITYPLQVATRFSSLQLPKAEMNRKQQQALLAFYKIFEAVSIPDERASTVRLTPRQVVEIPAGTILSVDVPRILELLDKSALSEEEMAEIVVSFELNGKSEKFSFYELRMLPTSMIDDWRQILSANPASAYCNLVAQLHLLRYPFEESFSNNISH